jgi:hypothetical protein
MSAAIPTAGYRSKSQAAAGLRAQGFTHAEVARQLRVPIHTVGALIASAKRARRPAPPVSQVTITLAHETWAALQPAAVARGISMDALMSRLLTHVARDLLADAVLDDGGK